MIVSLVCGWFVYFLGRILISALRSGVIRHTDSSKSLVRSKNPVGYWFLIGLFALFISLAVIVWSSVFVSVVF
jgi:hypothetical protein